MDNKNERHHYRYKSIGSQNQNKKITQRCSSILKYTFLQHNRTLTNYKSIRGIRFQATPKKHNQTQQNLTMRQNHLKQSRRKQNNIKIISQEMIEVAKMKLHDNSPEKAKTGVKSEMTMNRDELQYFLRKKKPVSYTMSRSAQQIKKLFSKRIQVIISQLRVKTTQQTPKSLQVTQPTVTTPITPAKPKRIVMKGMKRYQTKKIITIQNIKSSTKAVKFLTQYQAGDVSGWEVQQNNEQFIRNIENEEAQQLIKRHHDTII